MEHHRSEGARPHLPDLEPDLNITSALPTDYGPDTASPLGRALRLPPGERPPISELIQLARRPAKPAPTGPLVSEWMRIPPTTREDCIIGGAALTIADRNGGLDWHDGWYYARYASEPRRTATLASERTANPVLAHIREHWLATERVVDVRWGLTRKGHPEAQGEGPPIWAEAHERSTVDRILQSAVGGPFPPNPDYPERILDRRTVYRWIATDEQLTWIGATLLEIAAKLPAERACAIRNWVANVVDNDEPTE